MSFDNSLNYKNSRYVSGGETEGTQKTVEWWDRKIFPRDPSDIEYTVEPRFANKADALDTLADIFYGDVSLWWVIAQYNNILDPVSEIIPGIVLMIPSSDRVKIDFISNVTGGRPTARMTRTVITPIIV